MDEHAVKVGDNWHGLHGFSRIGLWWFMDFVVWIFVVCGRGSFDIT